MRPDRALAVRVETTPEPPTIALVGFGCASAMLARLRRGLRSRPDATQEIQGE